MKKHLPALLLWSIIIPGAAFAQGVTPRVDQREANQERRIDQGTASGSLTGQETNRLERGQQHVENMENRAKVDGVVTRQERRRLHQAQALESRRVYAEKHDRQHDFNHDGRTDRPRRR